MIQYTNIHRIDGLLFSTYQEMKEKHNANSFSYLNHEKYGTAPEVIKTDKMIIGSIVDGILTSPSEIDFFDADTIRLYPIAKQIAHLIKKEFGMIIKLLTSQVSYFAEMVYMNHMMKTTGRLDFLLPGVAVIDLKVTHEKNYMALIERMGYRNQVWHYCKLAGVSLGFILIHSVPLKQTFIVKVDVTERNEWMESKVLKLGVPIAA